MRVHAPSRALQLLRALRSAASGRGAEQRIRFLKAWAKFPVEHAAAKAIAGLPVIAIDSIVPSSADEISVQRLFADSGEWSLNLTERLMLSVIVKGIGAFRVFEIGTFDGGTTKLLAELIPPDGEVTTLDLPAGEFEATQRPHDFHGDDVGRAFRGSAVEGKIQQLRVDSRRFDPSPLAGSFDVVLVDGAHDYEHGFIDTKTALRLVRSGGVVLWDDFEPYWAGLVQGIIAAMAGKRFGRLHGTSMAVYVAG